MNPDQILRHAPQALDDSQRRDYFEQGYLYLESFLPVATLATLQSAYRELIERYRHRSQSDDDVLIEADHSADNPRFKRINRATDQHQTMWAYAANSVMTDVVSDLVGPAVRIRESYINCKSPQGGEHIDWHQDFPFFPHTNKALLTVLTFLEDVSNDMGPIRLLPGSHKDTIYDHYDAEGRWAGKLADKDVASLDLDKTVSLCGPAGTVVIFDCCVVHGSAPNRGSRARPLLLTGFSAADAFCYTTLPSNMRATQALSIVRGEIPTHAHHDPVSVKLPPDWGRERYINIFDAQQ